jgi:phosphatidate phosphatase APP1
LALSIACVVVAQQIVLPVPGANARSTARRAVVVIYDGFGSEAGAELSGRALEDRGLSEAGSNERRWHKLKRNLRALHSYELPRARVDVSVLGRSYPLRADQEGVFRLKLPGPLPIGRHAVRATLIGERAFRVQAGWLHVYSARPGVAVISDIDDTVLRTGVTNKLKMIRRVLLSNARDLESFPHAAALYRMFVRKRMPLIFVSGSPISFYSRLQRFFAYRLFPRAPIYLKDFGSDRLFDQTKYKLDRIAGAMALLPNYRFVLIGDSGEKDPEIYNQARRRYPSRVVRILIHNVTNSAAKEERFAGCTLFSKYSAAAESLLGSVLTTADVESVVSSAR